MDKMLPIPEAVYEKLLEAARASGKTPAGWIEERLPACDRNGQRAAVSDEELARDDMLLEACIISTGQTIEADNDAIDADLACEYGDDHSGLYKPRDGQ